MKQIYSIMMKPQQINLNPETELEEIMQNINTLLSTMKYSVPLYRSFGVDLEIDRPILLAKAKISAELYKAIQKYEPRVKVSAIKFDIEGAKLIPKVQVSLI